MMYFVDRGRANTRSPHRRTERGAVIPLAVLMVSIVMIATALTIDIGRATVQNRQLQLTADLAAIDSVRTLNGTPTATQQAAVSMAANRSADRNVFGSHTGDVLTVTLGTVDGSGNFTATGPTEVPDAVMIDAARPLDYMFVDGGRTLNRASVAASTTIAGVRAGSYLARADLDVTLANRVLGGQIDGSVNLTAVGYTGLADATVTLEQLAAAASVADLQSLLDLEVTAGQFFNLLVAAMNADGSATSVAAVSPLGQLALAAGSSATFTVGEIINGQAGTSGIGVIELVVADLVQLAAGRVSRDHVFEVDLGVTTADVLGITAKVVVIEGPQVAIGPPRRGAIPGATARTSQVRVLLEAELQPIDGTSVRLPLSADVARATAEVVSIGCAATGEATGVTVDVETSAASLRVGELTEAGLLNGDPATPATILSTPLGLEVIGSSNTSIIESSQQVTVPPPFGPDNRVSVGGPSPDDTTLSSGLTLEASIGGVAAPLPPLLGAQLNAGFDALAPALARLTEALGVTVAGADIGVFGATCSAPVIVR